MQFDDGYNAFDDAAHTAQLLPWMHVNPSVASIVRQGFTEETPHEHIKAAKENNRIINARFDI